MSERESVRLLFESAMMNARAVISAMNTTEDKVGARKLVLKTAHFHKLCKREWELSAGRGALNVNVSPEPVGRTLGCDHLWEGAKFSDVKRVNFRSVSL